MAGAYNGLEMSDADKKATPRKGPASQPLSPAMRLEPTRPPPRRKVQRGAERMTRMSPLLRVLSGLFTLIAVVLVGVGTVSLWYSHAVNDAGPLKESKAFVVRRGEGARDIAQRLEQDGAINNSHLFVLHYIGRSMAGWFGARPLQLKAGEYEIAAESSIADIAETLSEGKSVLYRFTVPEGLTSFQIVERMKADKNLTGDVAAVPPEGALLPDTYKFAKGMSRQALLDLMMAERAKFLEAAWAKRQPDLPLKSPEEALVLASIVEKETGRNDERTRVAAVFVNRLRQGMRLQSDPTILYGLFQGQVAWGRPIYRSEIQQRTAHNTYQIDGLPPTPICNPGRAAILATLAPAKTNDLFFVADGQGGHVFSTTLKDHNAAVQNWRKVEKEIRAKEAAAATATGPGTRAVIRPVPAGQGQEASGPAAPAPPPEKAAEKPPAEGASAASAAAAGAAAVGATAAAAVVPLPTRKPKR